MLDVGLNRVRVADVRGSGTGIRRRADSRYGRARIVSRRDLPGAAATAAGITAVISATAFALHWGPHWTNQSLRASIETAIALTILLAGALALVKFRRRTHLESLALLGALVAVGVVNFLLWAPQVISGVVHARLGMDADLVRVALVPLMFVVVAIAGRRIEVRNPRLTLLVACAICLAVVAVAEGADVVLGRTGAAAESEATVIVNVAASFVLVLAAAGLYWRSRPATAENCLLAGAALLLAAARFQAVTISVVPGAWITPRELLRLGAYGLLLAAVVTDYRYRRRADDRDAAAAEREELVRDLHDGLVQDLAAVAIHSEQLDPRGGEDPASLGDAARRALAASRRTIIDLSASTAPNTITSLYRVAHELEARFGTVVAVHVDADPDEGPGFDLDRSAHQRFVKVARDAIIRAASHPEVGNVDVVIRSRGTRWQLIVRGDGGGGGRFRPRSLGIGRGPSHPRPSGTDDHPRRRNQLNVDLDEREAVVGEPPCSAPTHE